MPSSVNRRLPLRRLGLILRELREARGQMLQAAAKELMFSASKLSRIETGQSLPTARDLRDLLTYFEIAGSKTGETITELARQATAPTWWSGISMLDKLAEFIEYETAASEIHSHTTTVVPGWLQTRDYARAVLARLASHLSEAELDAQADLRIRRQTELWARKNRPRLRLAIPEPNLHWIVDSPEVMVTQLERLIASYDDELVDLHIIPYSSGLNKSIEGGFTIFHFHDQLDRDVVAMESLTSLEFVDAPAVATAHREIFQSIENYWLSRSESAQFITNLLKHHTVERR